MSIYYATFATTSPLRETLDELLRGGVSPDDVSVITTGLDRGDNDKLQALTLHHTVGDATSYVGRKDDPQKDDGWQNPTDLSGLTSTEGSDIQGADTSNLRSDVDSIDQSDDSQSEAEQMLDPFRYTSNSTHQADEDNLEALVGFPTMPPMMDDVKDQQSELQDQFIDSFESFKIAGFGMVMGGGALATAALTSNDPGTNSPIEAIVAQLRDDGVSSRMSDLYRQALDSGGSVLAVAIVPGRVSEQWVEDVVERHGANNAALVDEPRY